MDAVYVEQFLDCFRRFITLCQLDNWPNDDTLHKQIQNAFLLAQHIEKCRHRMIEKNILNVFIDVLSKKINAPSLMIKICISEPPRCILKKIITSSANIDLMDAGFTIFLDLYSEDKLKVYLSDIMLEAASKKTLVDNVSTELSKSYQLEFNSQIFLTKIQCNNGSVQLINEMLKDCKQDMVDMMVVCLINKNPKYSDKVKTIVKGLTKVMASQDIVYKNFWKLLFRTEEDKFIQMCLNHGDIFELICTALIDCGKSIEGKMSREYFYIDLSYSEMSLNVQKICDNGNLKLVFLDLIYQSKDNIGFWEREFKV
ncbi:uncharacterized protein LOC112049089 isoform X1 [Bicyclus anynana]|uniref:Uncharacterized protein LOC112049089 isoform X1 n=1 Tax=Bicyclus anynana TaxID=110368 RepID=A0A6J1NHM8_BICAN|nr:uncharacterized protein LOC112049089 isoform X1 [Bicyclus anynana]